MSQSSSVAVTEGAFWNCGREMFVNVMLDVDELQYIMGRISKDTMRIANDLFWQQDEWRTTSSNLTCERGRKRRNGIKRFVIHVFCKEEEKRQRKKAPMTKLFLLSFQSKLSMWGPPLTLLKWDISFKSLLPSFKASVGGHVLRSSNLGYSWNVSEYHLLPLTALFFQSRPRAWHLKGK